MAAVLDEAIHETEEVIVANFCVGDAQGGVEISPAATRRVGLLSIVVVEEEGKDETDRYECKSVFLFGLVDA